MKQTFNKWLSRESRTFSTLCGETFTHKEVLMVHMYLLLLFVAVGIAGAIGG